AALTALANGHEVLIRPTVIAGGIPALHARVPPPPRILVARPVPQPPAPARKAPRWLLGTGATVALVAVGAVVTGFVLAVLTIVSFVSAHLAELVTVGVIAAMLLSG